MRRGRNWAVSLSALLGLWMLAVAGSVRADTVRIWHPPLKQPYKALVDDIVTGIRGAIGRPEGMGYRPQQGALPRFTAGVLPVEIENPADWVPDDQPGIVLTSPLLESLQTQAPQNGNKVAGLAFELEEISGISLNIDPETWLNRIVAVAPNVQDVFFVGPFGAAIDGSSHDGLIVHTVKSNVLGALEDFTQLQDSNGEVAVILSPTELSKYPQEYIDQLANVAWREQWVVASGRADLLQRGFTLALVPDYVEYGRELGLLFARKHRESRLAALENLESPQTVAASTLPLPANATRLLVSVRSARRARLDTRGPALRQFDEVRR